MFRVPTFAALLVADLSLHERYPAVVTSGTVVLNALAASILRAAAARNGAHRPGRPVAKLRRD